uniref:NADH dehydrogenase subunit 6 n=1 Tax=Leptorhynchoides thecatus TaxID=60532 RepID=Q5DNC3_LEPTH|nr:NADH dehydrogenase subunit 6 [Leptorhynchoides thecatus]AAT64934.1 NADH dehydrogenase subunit 6 [Leptorhynchoides thecatus]
MSLLNILVLILIFIQMMGVMSPLWVSLFILFYVVNLFFLMMGSGFELWVEVFIIYVSGVVVLLVYMSSSYSVFEGFPVMPIFILLIIVWFTCTHLNSVDPMSLSFCYNTLDSSIEVLLCISILIVLLAIELVNMVFCHYCGAMRG